MEGSSGSLLSWKASQELNLLQTVQQVTSLPSQPEAKTPADLLEEYDDLFLGLGKLKNYQVKLHIDEDIPPVAQPHRRVPFHVRKQLEEQLLNFGISSAAEIFQNVIRETLEGIDGAINISDDILVFGKTHSEHNRNLAAVFQRLREKRLTLNKSKCEYSKDKLEFFGYVFSKDGISPDPKKVKDVVNLQTPSTASEVRSLLGMTNYCSRFIQDYATKTEPLRKLTHKDQPWCWTAEHDRSVSHLKEALVSAPVTAYFCLLYTSPSPRDA